MLIADCDRGQAPASREARKNVVGGMMKDFAPTGRGQSNGRERKKWGYLQVSEAVLILLKFGSAALP
jgi:hypothetical protein